MVELLETERVESTWKVFRLETFGEFGLFQQTAEIHLSCTHCHTHGYGRERVFTQTRLHVSPATVSANPQLELGRGSNLRCHV